MNKLFIFGLGAAAGSLLTWRLLDKKYKDLADEEIKSVIEHFEVSDKYTKPEIEFIVEEESKLENKKVKTPYKETLEQLGYYLDENDNLIVSEDKDGSIYVEPGADYIKPYVIAPEEFGELPHYNTHSWTYYTDFVLTDDVGEIIFNPEEYIGDALTHFGEYEDDSVHVRNDNLDCDYEIIKCDKSFSELNKNIINTSEDNL